MWVWEPDGQSFLYSNFAHGQPNNYHGENCLSMEHGHSYKWDDDDCDNHKAYVCEKPEWVWIEFFLSNDFKLLSPNLSAILSGSVYNIALLYITLVFNFS